MRISPLFPRAWLIVPVCACGFLAWINVARIRHVEYVSRVAWEAPAVDARSPTGYAGGLRQLIVPEHNSDSYQWIIQTQLLLARGELHVRHVDYDNAPFGREVRSPSPYRWWLGLCAWIDHLRSGRPLALAVERAALFADPAFQLLLLAAAAAFAAWRFGAFPTALLSIVLAAAFPLAGEFLPGQPDDHGLSQACAVGSVLLLLAGFGGAAAAQAPEAEAGKVAARSRSRTFWWFFAGGVMGGAGMWINVTRQVPVIAGIVLGGIAASWLTRRAAIGTQPTIPPAAPWRAWGLGGAAMTLAAYLIEYFPAQMGGLRLETIHPLYGITWLGAAEIAAWAGAASQGGPRAGRRRSLAFLLAGVLAVAAVPAVMLVTRNQGALMNNDSPLRLTSLPNSPAARNIWAWVSEDGLTETAWATLLPVVLLGFAGWWLVDRATPAARRAAIALALGPALIALVLACFHLRWWNLYDTTLLALAVAVAAAAAPGRRLARGLLAGGVALSLTPALLLLTAQVGAGTREVVNDAEVEGLLERDLARWLSNQAGPGGAVVLAAPDLTASLAFYAGLRGLGTPYWENRDGFTAAVRIAGASTPDEAQAVARGRSLTHIVIPSWDTFLDEYARLGSNQPEHTLIALLHRWVPPRWLQPVPFQLPKISGFEDQSVAVFAVVDVQDNATALSRLAEYFVEMDQLDTAASASQALERSYPADLGALVARALVAHARDDGAGFDAAMTELEPHLARGEDQAMPWDRRVSLAVALTQGKRMEQAREQVRQCLAGMDEPRLRSLSTVSLFRLQMMAKAFGIAIADERLRTIARQLLPTEMRARL